MNSKQNYVVVKSTKSTGVGILLTLLLGPIGLFYASVTGGLVMTLIPFFFAFFFLFGILGGGAGLVLSSLTMLVFFGLTSWIICIIWSVIAIRKYNEDLLENASSAFPIDDTNASTIPNENISATNIAENTENVRIYEPYNSDSTGQAMLILFGLILLSLILYKLYDKETGSFRFSSATSIFDPHQKDKEEIKATIENAYIELMNGSLAYKSLGTSQDGGRFYNDNFKLTLASSFLPLMAMGNNIEVRNVQVGEFTDENSANVSYNLLLTENEKSDSASVEMIVKKVGGNWKLDAEKFLDFKAVETKTKSYTKKKKAKS